MNFITQTPRFWLRQFEPTDVDDIFELDASPQVHAYLGGNPIISKKEAEKTVAFVRQQYQEIGFGRWAVIEKTSGNFMGWSGIKLEKLQVNGFTEYVDVGYRLKPEYWGQGVATETATEALRYAFQTLHLPEVHGAANIENLASNRVLAKIGLHKKNTFHYAWGMHHWYSLTQEEWNTQQRNK